ncbi:hypothetical protein ACS0PU_009899 [Formica fusca]
MKGRKEGRKEGRAPSYPWLRLSARRLAVVNTFSLMRKDSGRTSATPTRSGASVPCSAPYAMLDSARLLVARRMDIEPLVRIPLPVC